MTTTRIDLSCPHCQQAHELTTSIDARLVPSAGAISICMRCGELAVYADELVLRVPTIVEDQQFATHRDLQHVRTCWRRMDARRKARWN